MPLHYEGLDRILGFKGGGYIIWTSFMVILILHFVSLMRKEKIRHSNDDEF